MARCTSLAALAVMVTGQVTAGGSAVRTPSSSVMVAIGDELLRVLLPEVYHTRSTRLSSGGFLAGEHQPVAGADHTGVQIDPESDSPQERHQLVRPVPLHLRVGVVLQD